MNLLANFYKMQKAKQSKFVKISQADATRELTKFFDGNEFAKVQIFPRKNFVGDYNQIVVTEEWNRYCAVRKLSINTVSLFKRTTTIKLLLNDFHWEAVMQLMEDGFFQCFQYPIFVEDFMHGEAAHTCFIIEIADTKPLAELYTYALNLINETNQRLGLLHSSKLHIIKKHFVTDDNVQDDFEQVHETPAPAAVPEIPQQHIDVVPTDADFPPLAPTTASTAVPTVTETVEAPVAVPIATPAPVAVEPVAALVAAPVAALVAAPVAAPVAIAVTVPAPVAVPAPAPAPVANPVAPAESIPVPVTVAPIAAVQRVTYVSPSPTPSEPFDISLDTLSRQEQLVANLSRQLSKLKEDYEIEMASLQVMREITAQQENARRALQAIQARKRVLEPIQEYPVRNWGEDI